MLGIKKLLNQQKYILTINMTKTKYYYHDREILTLVYLYYIMIKISAGVNFIYILSIVESIPAFLKIWVAS